MQGLSKSDGAIVILFAFLLPGLLLILAYFIETGYRLYQKEHLLNIAISSCHAGAIEIKNGKSPNSDFVLNYINNNYPTKLTSKEVLATTGFYAKSRKIFNKRSNVINAFRVSVTKDSNISLFTKLLHKKQTVIATAFIDKDQIIVLY